MAATRKWYHWFAPEDSPADRKLILKLDLLIVPYAFLVYWIKYIDQINISNAYASGMSTDLGFHGNELVQFQTIYTVGSVVGALPFIYIFPRVPMHWLVPALDLLWGIFTLLQYRAQSYAEVAAYRFLVAIFEASFFPGVHFVLGSWYRSDEIGRRGGFFYIGLTLGTLTASLLEAGVISNLDGVNGIAGWRWAYIINAIMTFPFAIAGFFIYPGTPQRPNLLVLSRAEVEEAKARLSRGGSKVKSARFSWRFFRRVLVNWKFWLLTLWNTIFFNSGCYATAYLLWLKSLGRYTKVEYNNLNAIAPGMGIFFVLFINFGSDLFFTRIQAILVAESFNFTALTILTIWNVPEGAKWFAYAIQYSSVSVSSVLFGWVNILLRDTPEERALYLILITTIANSFVAWIPLLTYPTSKAPRFPHGYGFSLAMCILMTIVSLSVWYLFGNEGEKRKLSALADTEADDRGNDTETSDDTEDVRETDNGQKTNVDVALSSAF